MTESTARETLLKYAKSKQNGILPAQFTRKDSLLNPLCGDQVEMHLVLQDESILQLGFAAKACAICTASAALLTEQAKGWTSETALQRRIQFESAIVAPVDSAWPADLAHFEIFSHLRVNPSRRTCAILPWLLLAKILQATN